jgi:hypothetical protein
MFRSQVVLMQSLSSTGAVGVNSSQASHHPWGKLVYSWQSWGLFFDMTVKTTDIGPTPLFISSLYRGAFVQF